VVLRVVVCGVVLVVCCVVLFLSCVCVRVSLLTGLVWTVYGLIFFFRDRAGTTTASASDNLPPKGPAHCKRSLVAVIYTVYTVAYLYMSSSPLSSQGLCVSVSGVLFSVCVCVTCWSSYHRAGTITASATDSLQQKGFARYRPLLGVGDPSAALSNQCAERSSTSGWVSAQFCFWAIRSRLRYGNDISITISIFLSIYIYLYRYIDSLRERVRRLARTTHDSSPGRFALGSGNIYVYIGVGIYI